MLRCKQYGQLQIILTLLGIGVDMADNIKVEYMRGDRVYNHTIAQTVTINNITLTPQRQPQYGYTTDKGMTGVAAMCDLGDAPSANLDANTDNVLINQCSIAEILAAFPSLPGGKGVLARKILQARNESTFDDEINFINRMIEVAPKCDWEAISHRLRFDKLPTIAV
jgi:hypothetical protein